MFKQFFLGFLAIVMALAVTSTTAFACSWPEAKVHIDWVLFKDKGAKEQYERSKKCGATVRVLGERIIGDECLPKFDALMEAQSHNAHAQYVIRQCRAQTERYLEVHG